MVSWSAAEDHVLQPLLDEHIGQANGMASAGTGGADGEVDALDMEDGAEVHINRRVHRLENASVAEHLRVMFLLHDFRSLNDWLCRRVVTKDAAYLVVQ